MPVAAAAAVLLSRPAARGARREYGIPTRHLGTDVSGESVDLPMVGMGTWQYNDTKIEEVVKTAFTLSPVPFRLLDTAHNYNNSVGIGAALRALSLPREQYSVTTKVEGGLSAADTTAHAEENLAHLGLDYVDLLLLHMPCALPPPPSSSTLQRQEAWRALEAQYRAGKARAIGVSHFCVQHMADIYAIATVRPVLNQVQYHVGMGSSGVNATDLTFEYCKANDVVFASWSPLCGPCCLVAPPGSNCTANLELLTGEFVTGIGQKYNKSGAQVALRWQVQQDIPVIPKSANPDHLRQNIDMFGWELDADDMAALTAATTPEVANPFNEPGVSGDCPLP